MACDQQSSEPPPTAVPAAAQAVLPEGLFVTQEPPGAKEVSEVKAEAAATGEVVLRGRIGGRVETFVKDRAIFMLADSRLPTCRDKHGDGCPTPWDYCCEPKEKLLARTASIQVVGPDGQPLKLGLQGRHGLEPMVEIVVSGMITSRDGGTLLINAERIFVKKAS
jgi:hypothetical protein